jgi:hypothetical protein
MLFKASEYNNDIEKTGNEEIYSAENIDEAVQKCLYTKRLRDASAFVGPSGRVVHTRHRSWAVTTEKA